MALCRAQLQLFPNKQRQELMVLLLIKTTCMIERAFDFCDIFQLPTS